VNNDFSSGAGKLCEKNIAYELLIMVINGAVSVTRGEGGLCGIE
jgi:hypothetical protein